MMSKFLETCVEYVELKEPMNFNLISSQAPFHQNHQVDLETLIFVSN